MIDQFGVPITLKYKQQDHFKTKQGGFVTLVLAILTFIFVVLKFGGTSVSILPPNDQPKRMLQRTAADFELPPKQVSVGSEVGDIGLVNETIKLKTSSVKKVNVTSIQGVSNIERPVLKFESAFDKRIRFIQSQSSNETFKAALLSKSKLYKSSALNAVGGFIRIQLDNNNKSSGYVLPNKDQISFQNMGIQLVDLTGNVQIKLLADQNAIQKRV